MGYYFALGNCFVCRNQFKFNPELVPSKKGEPICQNCMDKVNKIRKQTGFQEFVIPKGAYDIASE